MRFSYKGDWSKRKLNEICQFFKGNGLSKSDLSNEGFPCILYGELYTTYKNEVISDIISKTNTTLSNPFLSRNNDLIIPGSGEDPIDIAVARAIYHNDIILGGDLNILRPKPNVSAAFLSYQLNGVRRYDIAKRAQGKSIVHLHNSDLKEVLISIPTYDEQLHIVKLLTKIDEMIETQSKIIEETRSYINTIKEKLIYRNNNLNERCKISKIAKLRNGYSFKSDSYNEEGMFNIITISNVTGEYFININKCNKILEPPLDMQEHQKLKPNDILISLTGNVGRVSKVFNNNNLLNQRVGLLEVDNRFRDFVYHCLSSTRFENDMISKSQGAAQKNIGNADVESFIIPLTANLFELNKITFLLNKLEERYMLEMTILNKYLKQKEYLLQNLFI